MGSPSRMPIWSYIGLPTKKNTWNTVYSFMKIFLKRKIGVRLFGGRSQRGSCAL